MSTALRDFHDRLMAMQPEGAEHPTDCPFCVGTEVASASTAEEGSVEKTYTEAEYDSVVAQVTALEAKVAELAKAAEESALDSKVAEVKAELEAQIADLQAKLDEAVVDAETAKKAHADFVAELTEIEEARVAAEAAAARKDERVAAAKEFAPEEYLEANADRFAAMSDEDWASTLDGWRAIAAKTPAKTEAAEEQIPAATAMTASRSNDSGSASVLTEVLGLRFAGIDTRTV